MTIITAEASLLKSERVATTSETACEMVDLERQNIAVKTVVIA